jgi:RES domain.
MSPAGIPLFYGASSPRTAVQEVTRHATDATPLITYAAFETTRPCTVVDFTRLIPSLRSLIRVTTPTYDGR